jgi:hypothetical protein
LTPDTEGELVELSMAHTVVTESSEHVEKKLTGKKMPLVSCNKYDEEERKTLIGEEQRFESFSGSMDEE